MKFITQKNIYNTHLLGRWIIMWIKKNMNIHMRTYAYVQIRIWRQAAYLCYYSCIFGFKQAIGETYFITLMTTNVSGKY